MKVRRDIAANVERVRHEIALACAKVNRDPSEVDLVAVSKTQPIEAILEAAAAGVQHFGENRVEEANGKILRVNESLSVPVKWHMVGHVQSRKSKQVSSLFQVVHSVDTFKLANKFSQLMVEQDGELDIFLQINVSGEATKSGIQAIGWEDDQNVRALLSREIEQIGSLPGLKIRGLMTMAPLVTDIGQTRPFFSSLAQLRTMLATEFGLPLPDLSMGMTEDYAMAIEEGSTIVRIGRAIFGEHQ